MNQKGFAPILIVVILALIASIAGGAYYLGTKKSETFEQKLSRQNPNAPVSFPVSTPSNNKPLPSIPPINTNETANWKTYTGEAYSINYPSNYKVKEQKQDGWVEFYLPKIPSTEQDYWKEQFMISIEDSKETDICKNKVDGYPNASCIKVGNITFLDWMPSTKAIGPLSFTYSTIQNGKEYQISFLNIRAGQKDQILSTFKFTQ